MADGWEEGEPHWQIGTDGTLILGVRAPSAAEASLNARGAQYHAPRVFTPERFGRWVHLAVVYDRDEGEVVHYVDGQPASRSALLFDAPCGSATPNSATGTRPRTGTSRRSAT
jgi:hypothetical protein